jgi:ribokinase
LISRPTIELTVLGAINWDTTIFEEDFASPGEEVPVLRLEEGPGGKGANAAVAAARILGRGQVAFVGALGDDRFGRTLREGLRAEGVLAEGVITIEGVRSGSAHIIVDRSGGKTIHTHFGANDALKPVHLETPGARRALASASTVVLMDVPIPAAIVAARKAKRAGARLVYSPGVRCGDGLGPLVRILRIADAAVFDRSELLRLQPSESPRRSVASLTRRFPGLTVVATMGPSGSLVGTYRSVTSVPPVNLDALGLKAVNSTGSGDAFLAAYVCYSNQGSSPAEAAGWGNLAGALKATSNATRGSPTRADLEAKMAELSQATGRRRG